MKICHTSMYYDTMGGIRTYLEILNESLLKAKIESKIISLNFRSRKTTFRVPILGIYPYLFVMSLWSALIFSVRNKGRYIIHAHDTLFGGLTGVFIKFLLRRPLIITDHGLQSVIEAYTYTKIHGNTLLSRLNRIFLSLLKNFVVAHADKIICVSEYTFRFFLKQGIDSSKMKIVNNGVDIKRFKPERSVFSNNNITMLYAGRISPEKNVGVLIKVFSLLEKDHKNLDLLIVGEGLKKVSIKNSTDDFKMDGRITVLPQMSRNSMASLYNHSDIVVFPSIIETGTPLALLEAMACERVVVVNSSGFLPHIINNAGLTVPFNDPLKASMLIKGVLNDREKAITLARCARERVVKNFNWQNCFEEIINTYFHSLKGTRSELLTNHVWSY